MTDPDDVQYMGATRSMISTDPPKHTKLRAVVNRGFTPKMIARAEAAVRERARGVETAGSRRRITAGENPGGRGRARRIVDTIAPRGEAEFVTEVADALPVA